MNSGSEVTALKSKDFVRVEYAAKLLPSSEQRELIEVLVNALFEQGDPEYEGGRLLLPDQRPQDDGRELRGGQQAPSLRRHLQRPPRRPPSLGARQGTRKGTDQVRPSSLSFRAFLVTLIGMSMESFHSFLPLVRSSENP